ncbi:MAG: hypothetical protein Q7T55_19340 [Solirubrobacteraceae bacterium]|nr:hypothetical protein [Solirubrobacteraceae bacterium]
MTPGATERVQAQLGLADDELCDVLGLSPVQLLSGEGDLLPQTTVLDELLRASAEQVNGEALRRWLRASGPKGTPYDHLVAHDYGAFEDALETLLARGFVIRKRDA